ncbi:hypothetical protein M885DRAFT_532992 [Pelagophyceae sp. CCMP2097]|nr:hypothetical protein M885DRAFT_532992 [Pelagophyceae sp. CCMP2097]|mmetsp:Transcript_20779/g.71408  ORF Transcript_20779/g.71408 Transcript_20779/m.71408 type:complete len:394 (-) Transcript_20779:32-1213(-)
MASQQEAAYAALDASEKAAFARTIYAVLGLAAGCGADAIKKAYRTASLLYHPDKQKDRAPDKLALAESMFMKVKEAYELLLDDKRREELDVAVAFTEKARVAHAHRMATMDLGRRKFRDNLERNEAAARGTGAPPPKKARAAAPPGETTEARVRRENHARTSDFAEKSASSAAAADAAGRGRADDLAAARRRAGRDEQSDRLRRSLKIRFKSGAHLTDDEMADAFRPCGRVAEVARAESGKGATLLFDTAEEACAAAIDESAAALFKEVRLVSGDAWERVQAAVTLRAAVDRASAPKAAARMGDAGRARERADMEAQLQRETGDDDAPDAVSAGRQPTLDAAKRGRLRLEVAASLLSHVQAAVGSHARAFAAHETDVITRLLAAAQQRHPVPA